MASGYCIGCGRTIDEITEWSSASAVRQRAIHDGLAERLMQLGRTVS